MSTIYSDDITFKKDVTLTSGAVIKYASKHFGRTELMAGSLSFANGTDIPENALILGAFIKTISAPTFSAGTTTGVTAKVGTAADDDGFGQAISIAGTAGLKVPEPGARLGALNTTQNILVAFTPTGGTPSLSEISSGDGTVTIAYAPIPA